jgi:hypothetical protein
MICAFKKRTDYILNQLGIGFNNIIKYLSMVFLKLNYKPYYILTSVVFIVKTKIIVDKKNYYFLIKWS